MRLGLVISRGVYTRDKTCSNYTETKMQRKRDELCDKSLWHMGMVLFHGSRVQLRFTEKLKIRWSCLLASGKNEDDFSPLRCGFVKHF